MQSKASTPAEYLKSLPDDRREAIEAVRKVILKNLDKDVREGMNYGMLCYSVPHSVYPPGYHCDPKIPLPYAGLASQKQYMSLYLNTLYSDCLPDGSGANEHAKWFQGAWKKTGKKLDMGKSCIRFKKVDDLALDVIGEAIRRMPAKLHIELYEKALEGTTAGKKRAKKAAAKNVSKSVSAAKPTPKAKSTAKRASAR